MLKVELKPCPFCGSKAYVKKHFGVCSESNSWYEAECSNMACGPCHNTENEAAEYWNKRVPAAEYEAVVAERDRLRATLVSWVNVWLKDFLDWLQEDEIRIEFLKQDCPELLERFKAALREVK